MGYDPVEALGAANNKDVGLAAFLLGSQNQELTQIAQDFATDLGLGDAFDTSYDDAPDYQDLFDGDAQVELTSPSSSEAIVEAKVEVQEAKDAYSTAVETANASINDATKAKGDLETLRASIESVSGKDTSKWTSEQIEQYNKAVESYNTAVTKANENVALAEEAKSTYVDAKESLQKVENGSYGDGTSNNPSDVENTGNDTGTTPDSELKNENTEQDLIDQLFGNQI